MQLRTLRAEFQHIAEHSDAAALRTDRRLAEQRNGGGHGGRVGVVAFVDQQGAAARQPQSDAGAAANGRLIAVEGKGRERKIGAGEDTGRQYRQRIEYQMSARRAELVGDVLRRECAPRRWNSRHAARNA